MASQIDLQVQSFLAKIHISRLDVFVLRDLFVRADETDKHITGSRKNHQHNHHVQRNVSEFNTFNNVYSVIRKLYETYAGKYQFEWGIRDVYQATSPRC